MSGPLLDLHPVSFRVYFPGRSRYRIVTTVLDHVIYYNAFKRKQILNKLKSDSLTAAVEDEIRAVCRELLAGPDCPRIVHQRLTTIRLSRASDASVPTPSGCHQPQSCTLVVAVNPEGAADQLWGSVASRLHQFSVSTGRTAAAMVPPRRSRRLTIMPEPPATAAAAAPSSRARAAGRGSRSSRPTSPARRPASPGAAARPAAGRGRPAAAATSPPAPAARGTTVARKKGASPASTASTASRRSIPVRTGRRSVAVSPPTAAAARRQAVARRSKAGSPPPPPQRPRKSSMSPVKERGGGGNRKIRSPSFAREIRVRTLNGVGDEMMDFNLPEGMTGSKNLILDDLLANPTVVLETPGLLKRFSKKMKESSPPTKPAAKSPESSVRSSVKSSLESVKRGRGRPRKSVSAVKVGGEGATSGSKTASAAAAGKDSPAKPAATRGRPSTVGKRARAESRSPSATPPKKTRVASEDAAEPVLRVAAGAGSGTDSPPPSSVAKKRGRPSMASVRKSLNASLVAVPKAASSPASPALRVHTPAVTPASSVAARATRVVTKVSLSVTELAVGADLSPRRSAAALPPPELASPEREAGMQALLAARSSIRRRPAGQPPPPDALSASPNLKPAREAAAASLNRAYVALARSEAKQKDLFRTRVTVGAVAAASPALVRPAEKTAPEKPSAEETTVFTTTRKSTMQSVHTNQVVSGKLQLPVESASTSDRPVAEAARQPSRPDAVDGVFASPASRGTPRGQLAPRSSVRRAPASALRRVLDRAPESAARSAVRRVLTRPSPPPGVEPTLDAAAGGDSPLVEAPVTRSRRAKLASELLSPADGATQLNNVRPAGAERPLAGGTRLADGKEAAPAPPQRRSVVRTTCLMLLLLIAVVLAVLWLARAQLPAQQQEQLQQLQRSVEQQGRQLEQLVRQQAEVARGWLGRQAAALPVPGTDQ